jgi:hypothetical protein
VACVDAVLRVRQFFAHGGMISIREFVICALNDVMGLQAVDPDLAAARAGAVLVTPSGMVLDGTLDLLDGPPALRADEDPDKDGVANEVPRSLVDYLEFYLLNYFSRPRSWSSSSRTETACDQSCSITSRLSCAPRASASSAITW